MQVYERASVRKSLTMREKEKKPATEDKDDPLEYCKLEGPIISSSKFFNKIIKQNKF